MDPNQLRHILHHNPIWSRFANYKEVPIVAELIFPNDRIWDVGFGMYEDHNGLVVVTESRILFGGRKAASLLGHAKTEVFEMNRVTSVQVNSSAVLSTLVIVVSGAKGEIKSMPTADCRRIADVVRQRLSVSSTPPQVMPEPSPPVTANAFVDEITRLATMRQQGLLTDDEFKAAKAKLLGMAP